MILTKEMKTCYSVRDLQKYSLPILEEFHRVCQEHNLKYYIIAGTLLGAVRHKGFIPWDDDMDVALSRPDYDTLMAHKDEWFNGRFEIIDHSDLSYPKYFAKIQDKNTTLIEEKALGYVGGLYMDIFAFDAVPDNKFLRYIHYKKFMFYRKMLYLLYRNPFKRGIGPSCIFPLLLQKTISRKWLHNLAQSALTEYNYNEHNLVMTHDDGFHVAYTKKMIGTPKPINFEGLNVMGVENTDDFLSLMYGDYMKIPPANKRNVHNHYYCDFNSPYKKFHNN